MNRLIKLLYEYFCTASQRLYIRCINNKNRIMKCIITIPFFNKIFENVCNCYCFVFFYLFLDTSDIS